MSGIVLYEDGIVSIETAVEKDTLWLSQQQIAELFDVQRPAITKHLYNIFKSDELSEKVVCSILEQIKCQLAICKSCILVFQK